MSRLADILSTTATQNSNAASLLSAASNSAAAREASLLGEFQALFSQELAAQAVPATQNLAAATTEYDEQQELAQTLDPDTTKAAELIAWLPLATPPETLSKTANAATEGGAALLNVGRGKASAGWEPLSRGVEKTSALPLEQGAALGRTEPASFSLPGDTKLPAAASGGGTSIATKAVADAGGSANAARAVTELGANMAELRAPVEQMGALRVATTDIVPPAPATTSASATVAAPFGAADWREEFGQQIVLLSRQESSSAQLRLNPPQLGPIEVSITVKNEVAEASFTVAHAPVKEAIEAAIPRLREMFAEAGLSLGNALVSQDFGQAKQAFAQSGGNGERGEQPPRSGETAGHTEILAVVRKRGLGLVDTFA